MFDTVSHIQLQSAAFAKGVMMLHSFLFLLFSCLVLAGCDRNIPQKSADAESVTYQLPLDFDETKTLRAEQVALGSGIKNGTPVSFSALTHELLESHLEAHEQAYGGDDLDRAAINKLVAELTHSQRETTDVFEAKKRYETKFEQLYGAPIAYDRDSVTLAFLQKVGALQCYSGTILQQLIWRTTPGFRGQNPVVIFERGHVLPGFMRQENGQWNLYGIETTASDRGEVRYGSTSGLSGPIVVVDAESYVILEVFKGKLKNEAEVSQIVVEQTARKYGIDLEKTRPSEDDRKHGAADGARKIVPNLSPFSFGEDATPMGRRDRSRMELVDKRSVRTREEYSLPDQPDGDFVYRIPFEISDKELQKLGAKVERVGVRIESEGKSTIRDELRITWTHPEAKAPVSQTLPMPKNFQVLVDDFIRRGFPFADGYRVEINYSMNYFPLKDQPLSKDPQRDDPPQFGITGAFVFPFQLGIVITEKNGNPNDGATIRMEWETPEEGFCSEDRS